MMDTSSTVEPDCDMFGFLGIDMKTDDQIELTQRTHPLKTTGMWLITDTPAANDPWV
jgi:hypothetical protein